PFANDAFPPGPEPYPRDSSHRFGMLQTPMLAQLQIKVGMSKQEGKAFWLFAYPSSSSSIRPFDSKIACNIKTFTPRNEAMILLSSWQSSISLTVFKRANYVRYVLPHHLLHMDCIMEGLVLL